MDRNLKDIPRYYFESLNPLIRDLHNAARKGELQSLLNLLQVPTADVISANSYGRTLLHTACETAQSEIVEFLLKNRAPVEAQDNRFRTPLMVAVERSHYEIVTNLVEEGGANVFFENKLGQSALFVACTHGDIKMMELLFMYGANLHEPNMMGLTTLHVACFHRQSDVVLFLLSKGAALNRTDKNGDTALHLSMKIGSRCRRILLACGADTTIVNHEFDTALELAKYYRLQSDEKLIVAIRKRRLLDDSKENEQQIQAELWEHLTRIEALLNDKRDELQTLKEVNAVLVEQNLEKEINRSRLMRNTVSDLTN